MVILMNILPHVFGAFALTTWISSVQVNKKSNILALQMLANIFYATQYFLLGLYSTAFMNIVSVFRCYIFGMNSRKDKETPFWILLIILFIIFIFALLYCKTFLDLIPILATLLYTTSTWKNNNKYIRYVFVICGFLFSFYNILVNAYISFIGNIFEVISGTISIIRFRKENK